MFEGTVEFWHNNACMLITPHYDKLTTVETLQIHDRNRPSQADEERYSVKKELC